MPLYNTLMNTQTCELSEVSVIAEECQPQGRLDLDVVLSAAAKNLDLSE